MRYSIGEKLAFVALILGVLLSIGGLNVVLWYLIDPPPSFSLVTADWMCTKSHYEIRLAGKVTIGENVCDQYLRK